MALAQFAVALFFWVHARHAGGAEWTTVQDGCLFVQRCQGSRRHGTVLLMQVLGLT